MGRIDRGKGVEANRPAYGAILWFGNPNHNVRSCFPRHTLDRLRFLVKEVYQPQSRSPQNSARSKTKRLCIKPS
jgi:hypothetical protein